MPKIQPVKPFLLMLYGYPGSGKTYFARQFTEHVQAAHLQSDKIRSELFEQPRYDKQENAIVMQLMNYMAEEFLSAGLSVVYDTSAARVAQRRQLSNLALQNHAQSLLVWFQMDQESAFSRSLKRDRRRADDKYTPQRDRTTFDSVIEHMQKPSANERYVVISGKHLFNTQLSAVVAKLRDLGSLSSGDASSKVIKPGMVNLVPNGPGRVDMTRRNISIR